MDNWRECAYTSRFRSGRDRIKVPVLPKQESAIAQGAGILSLRWLQETALADELGRPPTRVRVGGLVVSISLTA